MTFTGELGPTNFLISIGPDAPPTNLGFSYFLIYFNSVFAGSVVSDLIIGLAILFGLIYGLVYSVAKMLVSKVDPV